MSDEIVALTRELVERESENPPGNERRVAEYLETRLDSSPCPFDVESYNVEPDRPNVVASIGDPANGSVLLAGHVDVVPADPDRWSGNPYELRSRDDRVVGRGTADMKGALAAKIIATEAYIRSHDDPGQVILAFVVDEEVDGAGMRALVERGIDADAAIIGEPTELQVCVAQKGVARYVVTVHGESGHSGRPQNAVNAIDGMRRILDRIEALNDQLREATSHPSLAPETITVTKIKGGIAPNVVPDTVSATIDWRFHPGKVDPHAFDNRLQEKLDGVTLHGERVNVDVRRTVFARAAEAPTNHELVETMQSAAREAGVSTAAIGLNAATDARFLVHDAGIPTVLFGPGSIEHDAHTVDESVRIADLETTVSIYRSALARFLS